MLKPLQLYKKEKLFRDQKQQQQKIATATTQGQNNFPVYGNW